MVSVARQLSTRPAPPKRHAWIAYWLVLAGVAGCGRAGGGSVAGPSAPPAAASSRSATPSPGVAIEDRDRAAADELEKIVTGIDQLRRQARFEEFVDATLNAAAKHGDSAALQRLKTEALLAAGHNADAESAAQIATELALDDADVSQAAAALKLWAMARFRQQKPFDSLPLDAVSSRLLTSDPTLEMLSFWRDARRATGKSVEHGRRATGNEHPGGRCRARHDCSRARRDRSESERRPRVAGVH